MSTIKKYVDNPELVEKEADAFVEAIKSLIPAESETAKEVLAEIYNKVGKRGKKVVKRAVHLMRTRGIDTKLPEDFKGWTLPVVGEKKALFSSFDPRGRRIACGYVEKGKERYASFIVLHFLKGIIEPSSGETVEKNPIPILKERWREEGMDGYELPYEYFVYSIVKAVKRGKKKITPVFLSEKDVRDAECYDPSSLVNLPPLEVESTRSLIALLKEVHPYLPYAVLLPEEWVEEYLSEYINIKNSPIVLSSSMQNERMTEFIKKVSERLMNEKVMDAYADFMFDTSYIALQKSHIEAARVLKWWGGLLRSLTKNPVDVPIFREIFIASLEMKVSEKQRENLIIRP